MRPLATLLTLALLSSPTFADLREVAYSTNPSTPKGYLCRPAATGPSPAVLYNHGGVGANIGGAPKETCEALAKAGFIAFSPMRRMSATLAGHPEDVQAGLDYLLAVDGVDRERVAMIGFSRGGALTYMAARAAPIRAAVIMAAAAPPPQSGFTLADAAKIRIPLLMLVAVNDTGSRKTQGQNTLEGMRRMEAALKEGGNAPKMIVYPPYGGDGHELFYQVGGAYWQDLLEFLDSHLR